VPKQAEQKLGAYRAKRDFERTPEPPPKRTKRNPATSRFVIQEHHARALHWDFRLERDGVLVSWAVPKGLPFSPKQNHLAVHVEDHPLEYFDFEGEIPEREYGAGSVSVWDRGTYETEKFNDHEVMVRLRGAKISGRYVLFQTKGDQWMVHRMDPPADTGREEMPKSLEPMLPTPTRDVPTGDEWAFEVALGGVRALAYVDGGRVRLVDQAGEDIKRSFPEVVGLGAALGTLQTVLDGEVVILDGEAHPDSSALTHRRSVASDGAIRKDAKLHPATFMVYDVLFLDGRSTMSLPFEARRRLVDDLLPKGERWESGHYHVGDGPALRKATGEAGLTGLFARRLDGKYEPGVRSKTWLLLPPR
jgi:bifunctional non-homologous end joining protein LigD